jgi:hypothetical protein
MEDNPLLRGEPCKKCRSFPCQKSGEPGHWDKSTPERAAGSRKSGAAVIELRPPEAEAEQVVARKRRRPARKVDGAELLDKVEGKIRKFVVLPSDHDYVSVALWIAATHGLQAWEHAPRLVAVSPEKRCGKSRLMDVCECMSYNSLMTVNATVAAIVRSIKKDPPTLFMDEADTIFGTKRSAEAHEDLRGILNAGHQRGRYYLRVDMNKKGMPVEKLDTFSMAMLASIKDLPDTIMDRAVVVRMRRRRAGETVSPFRTARDAPGMRKVGLALNDWIRSHSDFPDEVSSPLEDRAADTWEPLLIVADLAGGAWPERARLAAKEKVDSEEGISKSSAGRDLLEDVRRVWEDEERRVFSHVLVQRLCALDEGGGRWARYYGHELTSYEMAELLRPYGIQPTTVKVNKQALKGYKYENFSEAWASYLDGGDDGARK